MANLRGASGPEWCTGRAAADAALCCPDSPWKTEALISLRAGSIGCCWFSSKSLLRNCAQQKGTSSSSQGQPTFDDWSVQPYRRSTCSSQFKTPPGPSWVGLMLHGSPSAQLLPTEPPSCKYPSHHLFPRDPTCITDGATLDHHLLRSVQSSLVSLLQR